MQQQASRKGGLSGGSRHGPFRVALTFDAEHPDRPTEPDVHDRIMASLERADVRATFFVQGRWAQAYPERARALPGAGHLVGSHSFYHVRMPLLSPAGLENDVRRAERAIHDIVKVDPRPWFRLPFGSGHAERPVVSGLEALGYRSIYWDVEGKEWRTRVTARTVARELVDGALARGDGAILLMHSWPRVMPAALDEAILRLR